MSSLLFLPQTSRSNRALRGQDNPRATANNSFRIYLRFSNGAALTPALANSYGWHVNWAAINGTVQAVKKYYDAGGTRIAMRDNGQLRWLLGDHPSRASLGSTSYTVNGTTEQGEVRYKPWGSTRYTSGTTPTTYRYTGQREEASLGLYYYGARWYDPALGRFIQPDTIVPDPGEVKAFDRYAYVNNNPLRYNDPSGHCISQKPLGEEPLPSPSDSQCWRLVDHILQLWNNDQSGYWNTRWVSQDVFWKYVAPGETNGQQFMLDEINMYWSSPTYQHWDQANKRTQAAEQKARDGDIIPTNTMCDYIEGDCLTQSLDAVGIGASILVVASPLCGPAAVPCAVVGTYVGGASTVVGVGYTAYSWNQGNASDADLLVTVGTGLRSFSPEPRIALAASLTQWWWDKYMSPALAPSKQPEPSINKDKK